MSAYRDAIRGIGVSVGHQPSPIVINTDKAGDNFWTAVKWIGAGIVLLSAYREAKAFYRDKLTGEGDSGEEEAEEG